jgi:hypothetical protein
MADAQSTLTAQSMNRSVDRVLLMADDLGRLRRAGVEGYVLERLCGHVDTLDAMLRPTAGLLCQLGTPVQKALQTVDGQRADLYRRMGLTRPTGLL